VAFEKRKPFEPTDELAFKIVKMLGPRDEVIPLGFP
jgi:hypothetical protein